MLSFKQYLKENPDHTITADGDDASFHEFDTYTFGYYKNKLEYRKTDIAYHGKLAKELTGKTTLSGKEARDIIKPCGRIWKNRKILTFWSKLPPPSKMLQIVKDFVKVGLIKQNQIQNWYLDLQVNERGNPKVILLIDYLNKAKTKVKKSNIKKSKEQVLLQKALTFLHVKSDNERVKLIQELKNGSIPSELSTYAKDVSVEDIKKIGLKLEAELGLRKSDTSKMKKYAEKQGFKTETELRNKMYVGDNTQLKLRDIL